MKEIPHIRRAVGRVTAPPSKSYTARALLLGAMSEGDTTLRNALDSDDSRFMLEAIRKIGFAVRGSLGREVTIGPRVSMSANEVELFVGNAGTAMRFLTGFLAFTPGRFILTGESRMLERPIGDLVDALISVGAEIEYAGEEGFPPLRIRGRRMRGGFEVRIAGNVSSQFVSSLMLVAPTLPGGVTLRVEALASRPYVEMTADILRAFGAAVEEPSPNVFQVGSSPLARDVYEVEGDYSSASYWLAAAAATAGEVSVAGLVADSAQGDRGFLSILESLGCTVRWSEGEVTLVGPALLAGGRFDCNRTPDIVPTLAAIAPFANAPVEIVNIANLRVKESDRIASVAEELRKLGASVAESSDSMTIAPGFSAEPAVIDSHNDHRIAMSFAIAGLRRGGVTIADELVVAKSYPRFWRTLEELVATSER
jgi:3-phosphoshikimate 1-carboxyvinyltransferase